MTKGMKICWSIRIPEYSQENFVSTGDYETETAPQKPYTQMAYLENHINKNRG